VTFPLPYRVLFLIGVGGLCWATNLHSLEALGIDTLHVLQIRSDKPSLPSSLYGRQYMPHNISSSSYAHSLHPPIYRLLFVYFSWIAAGWLGFAYFTGGSVANLDAYKLIPIITWLGVIAATMVPVSTVLQAQRSLLYRSLIRSCFSPRNQPVHFADVIAADILTSFAKVLGDIWLSIVILAPGGTLRSAPKSHPISEIAIPLLMSFPYFIRFRQCIVDYLGSNRRSQRPLYNAIKYATAFPVILLSAGQRPGVVEQGSPGTWNSLTRKLASQSQPPEPETMLIDFRSPSPIPPQQTHDHAHALKTSNPLTSPSSATFRPTGRSPTASLSSSSSSIDGSGALSSSSPFLPRTSPPKHPFGLRRRLLFRPYLVYYAALLLNLVLRFTWSLKLSSHLHGVAELESGVFIIEGAELLRRWMWVFFRVEWEVIRLEDDSETTNDIHLAREGA
ncbi:hypothetical protein BS47DRAFT_1356564, partial [Hydnum rufescens UP504]